jgi:hypothetical protein
MSALTAIVKKAKGLYKTGKYKKWTDAIKAASKGVKKAAPKKKATKKAAPKRKAAKKITGFKKGKTNFIELGEKKKRGKNIRIVRRTVSGKKGTFRDFITIGSVISSGKSILLEKLGKLEAKKFSTKLKRDKNKVAKEIRTVKTQLKKFM